MKLLFLLGVLMAIPAILNAYPDPLNGPCVATGRGNSTIYFYRNGNDFGYFGFTDDREFIRPRGVTDASITNVRVNIYRPSSYEFGYYNGDESNEHDKEVNSFPTVAGYGRDPSAGIRNSVPTEAGYGRDPSAGIRKPFPIMPHRRMTLLEAFFIFEQVLNGQQRFEGQRRSFEDLMKLKAEIADLVLRGLLYEEMVLPEPIINKVKKFFAQYDVEIIFESPIHRNRRSSDDKCQEEWSKWVIVAIVVIFSLLSAALGACLNNCSSKRKETKLGKEKVNDHEITKSQLTITCSCGKVLNFEENKPEKEVARKFKEQQQPKIEENDNVVEGIQQQPKIEEFQKKKANNNASIKQSSAAKSKKKVKDVPKLLPQPPHLSVSAAAPVATTTKESVVLKASSTTKPVTKTTNKDKNKSKPSTKGSDKSEKSKKGGHDDEASEKNEKQTSFKENYY